MKYHARYIHILIVSQDQEITAHMHPDDYMDLSDAPIKTSIFYIKASFPRNGIYSVAASFLFMDSRLGITREGFSQTAFTVTGMPAFNANATFNYETMNRFSTYPINDSDIFDSWIDVKTNEDDTNGFYGKLIVGGGSADPSSGITGVNATLNYVRINTCTYFYVTIYSNESSTTPAYMIPYLAAPVHFTVVNYDGGVYHAHGTFMPAGYDFQMVQAAMANSSMSDLMMMNPDSMMYNLTMNAAMIGVEFNGTVDCLSDEGTVVDEMGGMMDMSIYYGPIPFGTVAGIFDFPVAGHWRIFAYMKLRLPSGEERLIVPHFAIDVWDNVTAQSDMMSSSEHSSDSSLMTASLMLVLSLISLVF